MSPKSLAQGRFGVLARSAMLTPRPRQWIAALALIAGASYPACSTKAVGVDECRRIEYARCEAASNCPDQFSVKDVELCRLFYRDHCLHGLPASSAPTGAAVRLCIEAINDLSKCAAELDGDAALLVNCPEPVTATKPKITRACKLLAEPEAIRECSFLSGDLSKAEGGSGGDDGVGGASSSQGGSGQGGSELAGFGGLTL